MSKIVIIYLIALIAMASLLSFLVVHELTHLALSNKPYGVCFGKCYYYTSEEMLPKTSYAVSWAVQNETSEGEALPMLTGSLALAFVLITGITGLRKISNIKEADKK